MANNKNFFGAVAMMTGTAIGAGIFGIPYVMAQAGVLVGVIYLGVLGVILGITTLMYGEIVLRTKGSHQFTGYAEKYLGSKGKWAALVVMVVGSYGSLIAYLIEVPNFLQALFNGGDIMFYRLSFFVFVGLAVLIGLGIIVRLEKAMVVMLLLMLFVFLGFGFTKIDASNYLNVDLGNVFLPYGVILFALGALSAVPDMKNLLTRERGKLKKAIITGMCVPAFVYLVFSLIVVGVTGIDTTESAVLGLGEKLGEIVLDLGAVFGVLSMTTSFLVIGLVLKEVYVYDFKMNKLLAWALVLFVPLGIVLLNLLSFIEVLGIIGAFIGGGYGVMLIFIYLKAKKKGELKPDYNLRLPKPLLYVIGGVYILGIIYEVYNLIGLS